MKYQLYIDNFRGFKDSCIPIRQVNFLVGENSTGKTSVLGLMRLLTEPRLFMAQADFSDEHVNFGNFFDMVSAHSPNRGYFHIGIAAEHESKRGETTTSGYLLTYKADQGMPKLLRCYFRNEKEEMSLWFTGKGVQFKAITHDSKPSSDQLVSSFRSECSKRHSADGYRKLATPSDPAAVPLFFLLSFARNQADRDRNKKGKFKLEMNLDPYELGLSGSMCWVAPIRTKPKRTYDELTLDFSPEGAHTPYLIRRILNSKAQAVKFRAFMSRIGKATGLFEDVRLRNFGRGATTPFEVDVVLDGKGLNLNTVGYGVSQILPVLVELIARPGKSRFGIQQPEVHLHPKAQAALGALFFEMASVEGKSFLIETHSDFLVDRYRLQLKKSAEKRPDSQILFFERRNKVNVVTPLEINESGEITDAQPASYRSFFIREQMSLLGI